VNITDLYDRPT